MYIVKWEDTYLTEPAVKGKASKWGKKQKDAYRFLSKTEAVKMCLAFWGPSDSFVVLWRVFRLIDYRGDFLWPTTRRA